MKILAVITGIGYGHTTRQEPILKELQKRGAEIIVASYSNGFNFFEHKYNCLQIDGPKISEKKFRFSLLSTFFLNLKLPYFYIKNYFKLRRLIKAFRPDIIISDFEPLPLYMSKKIPHFLFFNFSPELYKEYIKKGNKKYSYQHKYISWIYKKAKKTSTSIILPSFEKPEQSHITYVNPIVRSLPKASQEDLLKKLNLSKPPIVVMFGGSYFSTNLLYKIQEVLPKLKENFLIFTYKISGESRENITFMPFKENFLEYLKASKAIITQAGFTTLSESLVLKKPSLIFPIPNFLEHSVNSFWARRARVSLVENPEHLSEDDLLVILKKFLSSLQDYERNLSKLNLEPNGAIQAADLIEEKFNEVKAEKSKSTQLESDTEHKSQEL